MTKNLEEKILMQRVKERKQTACAKKLYDYLLTLLDEKGYETSRILEYCPITRMPISVQKEYGYLRDRFIAQKYMVDSRGTIMCNFAYKETLTSLQGKKFEKAVAVYDKKHKQRVFYACGITEDDVDCYIPGNWEKYIGLKPVKEPLTQQQLKLLKEKFGL